MNLAHCNPSTELDRNTRKYNEIQDYWLSKKSILKRFTKPNGVVDEQLASSMMKSFISDVLDKPFRPEVRFTKGEWARMRIAIDSFSKDITGPFSNITGLFAVPRGLARLDPASNDFLMKLERAKNYERNSMSMTEFNLQTIKNHILEGHINEGLQTKWSKKLGTKSYKDFRKIRDELIRRGDVQGLLESQGEIQRFFESDNGRLLKQYNDLIKMNQKEFDTAVKDGYYREVPLELGVGFKKEKMTYNGSIVQAVKLTRQTLNNLGEVNINTMKKMISLLDHKVPYYTDNKGKVKSSLEAAIERIEEGMEIGDYFPRVHLESIYSMKKAMNDLIVEKDLVNISGKLNDLNNLAMDLRDSLARDIPENVRARSFRDETLGGLWETDPFVVVDKYARDAIQWNKNTHMQEAYLTAMRNIPNSNSEFIRGMKSFITEEYAVATETGLGREEWVNSFVRTVNGFQTARTMGLNITGGIKNALSVLHFTSKTGPKAILDSNRLYQDEVIKKSFDKVSKEEGFLFTPEDSSILLEGTIGKDKYSKADIVFNERSGEYQYKDTNFRDLMGSLGTSTVGKLLFFHRMTENAQKKHMFKVSFINKFAQLRENQGLTDSQIETYAKNYALKMVNGWAYEYAPFAKSKWVRGDGIVVDATGENYIVKKESSSLGGIGGGLSEIAFHLMHYPMSLLETHVRELKGAGQSVKAGQWDSPEMKYLVRYGTLYSMISAGSVILNGNLHNIMENETLNRFARIEKDLTEYDNPDRATFGLLSEFTGPTLGHMKYWLIQSGMLQLDTPLQKILFGNVDYGQKDDPDVIRYSDYQYGTEYGRQVHKILPALRDGRGMDVARHYLAFYPSDWIKETRRQLPFFKRPSKKPTSKEKNRQLAIDILKTGF